jgi:hypothetical protein
MKEVARAFRVYFIAGTAIFRSPEVIECPTDDEPLKRYNIAHKSPGLNRKGDQAGASIFGRAAKYTRNIPFRSLRPEWDVEIYG